MGNTTKKRMINAIESLKIGLTVKEASKKHHVTPQGIYASRLYKEWKASK
jgi:hypothetical protein